MTKIYEFQICNCYSVTRHAAFLFATILTTATRYFQTQAVSGFIPSSRKLKRYINRMIHVVEGVYRVAVLVL